MTKNRTDRLNSLLKEVISEVILREMHHNKLPRLLTVTQVDISKDLHHAKVFISIIGTQAEKNKGLEKLQDAAGYIASIASKKVVMRYFPALTFKIDDTVDKQMHIDALIGKIRSEREQRDERSTSSE